MRKRTRAHLVLLSAFLIPLPPALFAADSRVELRRDDAKGQMAVLVDGREALVYQYAADLDMAHFYPVRSPGGKSMTVQHPNPYPHHRSFWFADKVRLADQRPVEFYAALYTGKDRRSPPFRDHIRHVEFIDGPAEKDRAEITMKLVWEMDGNKPVLDETRRMRVVALGDGEYFLDITFTLTAVHGDVTFVSDAVHYAWPYIRMNTAFSVNGGGRMTSSQGGVNQQGTHNQLARWIDYSNTVEGETAGLAIFTAPDSPQPSRWLTRDYGTFGPRRPDARSGKPFTVAKGESITQRIGVLVHRGDVKAGAVAERYRRYVGGDL